MTSRPLNLDIALLEPEIPPNTGNIMRLCANTGARLHLIEPLGFQLDARQLRRAGMDYLQQCSWQQHVSLDAMLQRIRPARTLAFSTRGTLSLWQLAFAVGDCLLFGAESRGLPEVVMNQADLVVRLPMLPAARSMNLANCVAVASYEAWRQLSL
ncbi:MAG: tRNA (uridine(34)/cytosine(34)/5-carboxymethylaminomethyluridine (34)-2'-O)-methyltransferase TrmL [Wenzhouxiangellaceae bacterium]